MKPKSLLNVFNQKRETSVLEYKIFWNLFIYALVALSSEAKFDFEAELTKVNKEMSQKKWLMDVELRRK